MFLKLSQIFKLYYVQIITHKTDSEKFGKCNGNIPPCPNSLSKCRELHSTNCYFLKDQEQKSTSNLEKCSIPEPRGAGASTLSGMYFPCKMFSPAVHVGPSPKHFQRPLVVFGLCHAPITKTFSQIFQRKYVGSFTKEVVFSFQYSCKLCFQLNPPIF